MEPVTIVEQKLAHFTPRPLIVALAIYLLKLQCNPKYQVDQIDDLYVAYNDLTIIIINLQGTGLITPLQPAQ